MLYLIPGSYLGTVSQSSPIGMIVKSWPLYCVYIIIRIYNSDRDMLGQTSTSLVNNHFSHSPPGWEPGASYWSYWPRTSYNLNLHYCPRCSYEYQNTRRVLGPPTMSRTGRTLLCISFLRCILLITVIHFMYIFLYFNTCMLTYIMRLSVKVYHHMNNPCHAWTIAIILKIWTLLE